MTSLDRFRRTMRKTVGIRRGQSGFAGVEELEPRTLFSGTSIDIEKFVPFDVSNNWSYDTTGTFGPGTLDVYVYGQQNIDGTDTQAVSISPGLINDYEERYMTVDSTNGLKMYAWYLEDPDESHYVYADAPITLLPANPVIGTTYSFSSNLTWVGVSGDAEGLTANGELTNGQATVYAQQIISTPYGSFSAYQFDFSFNISGTNNSTYSVAGADAETWWLVEGLGPVKITGSYSENSNVYGYYENNFQALLTDSSLLYGLEFGDAPESYGTTFAYDGARHGNDFSTYLGSYAGFDSNGQPSSDASADDGDDGVTFLTALTTGSDATVRVNASASAYLNAWIDFNADGDFNDEGEQIVVDGNLFSGDNDLLINVPDTAVEGTTFARFRYSTQTGLAPTGFAIDGEVEDYQVTLVSPSTTRTDFNADGYDDVVFRNSSNGQNILWLMQGASKVGSVGLPTVADTHWTI
ncbi:MAG: hypothetical protein GC164_16175, partial [Phycisphaera sp.]|nr:hypothetical protein [Phycisphaera sp.]